MKERKGVKRLEQLLNTWEDMCFVNKISYQINTALGETPLCPPAGPWFHFEEFRKYILGYKGGGFDMLKFAGDSTLAKHIGVSIFTPMSILAWSHHSRRLFNLPSDVQTLLDDTSLGGIKWKEIRFPLDSFLVSLDDPLIDDDGLEYDAILVAKIDGMLASSMSVESGSVIELRLLPKKFESHKTLGRKTRKEIDSLVRRGSYGDAVGFLKSKIHGKTPQTPTIHIFLEMLKEETVKKSLPRLGDLTGQPDMVKDSAVDSALHIVANLCLYLENFSSGKLLEKAGPKKSSQKKRKSKLFKSDAITSEAEIFNVKCQFNMTDTEILKLVQEIKESKTEKEKTAHWRKAHWRRKPYCGHIPMKVAPKDWIPRKFINAHLLPPNSLPVGSEAVLT